MEIFFDYLPCRIRCSIFAYQFSLWNGSNPKKTSHYFRRSNVEKRRTISYKNVLEKKKKKKKKVFFLRVFILLLSPLILPKYIYPNWWNEPGGRQDFNVVSTYSRRNYLHSFPLYLRADLPVKLGRRRRRRDLNPLSTARDLCRNRDEKKSPSTLVTCNESISKFGSNGKLETTGVTRGEMGDRVEILDIKVVSQRWFYRDDKALVHPSIHSPGREAINLWLKRETRGQNGARQLVIRLAGDKRVSFTTAPSYFNAISRHWWRFSSRSRGGMEVKSGPTWDRVTIS